MRIEKITATKRGRYALFDEDGQFLFSVDGETLLKNNIAEGTALTAPALCALREESDERRAKDKALRLLSLRSHAAGELYEKLCRAFDAPTAASAVAEMQRLGLLDDAEYARRRAQYLAGQGKSRRQIEADLAAKGIGREDAAAALDEACAGGADVCYALVKKLYARKLAEGGREKVLAALARRGFSYGEAKSAVERALDEMRREEDGF